jgi:hypothetical protein
MAEVGDNAKRTGIARSYPFLTRADFKVLEELNIEDGEAVVAYYKSALQSCKGQYLHLLTEAFAKHIALSLQLRAPKPQWWPTNLGVKRNGSFTKTRKIKWVTRLFTRSDYITEKIEVLTAILCKCKVSSDELSKIASSIDGCLISCNKNATEEVISVRNYALQNQGTTYTSVKVSDPWR